MCKKIFAKLFLLNWYTFIPLYYLKYLNIKKFQKSKLHWCYYLHLVIIFIFEINFKNYLTVRINKYFSNFYNFFYINRLKLIKLKHNLLIQINKSFFIL